MPLRYVLDEHLRGGFWRAVRRACGAAIPPVEVTRVGDPPDLPCSTTDPDLLLWAEHTVRVIVTFDAQTMPVFHAAHLASGHHSSGIFIVRQGQPWRSVLDFLIAWGQAFNPVDVQDAIFHIP